nr:hypothetical protein [Heyndrickxia oleronia]
MMYEEDRIDQFEDIANIYLDKKYSICHFCDGYGYDIYSNICEHCSGVGRI